MLVVHLNDYPKEKQCDILCRIMNTAYTAVAKAHFKKDTLFKMNYQIKITGTSDPTVTITGSDVWNIDTILEL